ncbi:MAG: Imm30 family immunity protein [Cyanobacteriota bacterium]|nr:Imm30 family immunity protein [Cyanobacteriota bacterium]
MTLIETLKENRLMQTEREINSFETALAEIANNPNEEDLPKYHLILDDRCQQPEVMFGLVHFLESFEPETQLQAFIKVIPQLALDAPEWTKILHNRILNDEFACNTYLKILRSLNSEKPHFIYYLLEESAANHLKRELISMSAANQ